MNMATITKNVFSNHFSISFPIMSCYLLKVANNLLQFVTVITFKSCRLTAAHIILVNCSVSLLDFCDAAALIF